MNNHYLIIGHTGSLGNTLISYLLSHDNTVSGISRDEEKQWKLKIKYPSVNNYIGDIRNKQTILSLIKQIQPNFIIIAAALKYITTCEDFPWESVQTNIFGIQNVITSCQELELPCLRKVLYVSTDKSCSPVNTYGLCKSLSEKLMSAARMRGCDFVTVRYGNVLDSRGSIIPLLQELSRNEECLAYPLTDAEMTRFFMTLDESVGLIMKALEFGVSGDIFVPILRSFRLVDLFGYFSDKYGKPIKVVGLRGGEKIHECLINELEMRRTVRAHGVYVIKNVNIENGGVEEFQYSSNKCIDDISFVVNFIEKD